MTGDIVVAIAGMSFPLDIIRNVLRTKVEETGMSFSTCDPFIEKIVNEMQRRHKQTETPDVEEKISDIEEDIPVTLSNDNRRRDCENIDITCKICLDKNIAILFLPCQHMATCGPCAASIISCPICRAPIRYIVKPIF